MRINRFPLPCLFLSLGFILHAAAVHAAGTVHLELLGDNRGTPLIFQEWSQALGKAGIRNVRIKSVAEPGKPAIDIQGTETRPVYIVTGIILSRNEIALPGRRFRRSEVKQLAAWMKDLAENGPVSMRPKRGAFGLTIDESKKIITEIAKPVGFDTLGMAKSRAIEKIAARLNPPLRIDPRLAEAMGNGKVEVDLSGISRGTALAYLLRSAGMGFAPTETDAHVGYELSPLRDDVKTWPIGVEAEVAREALPGLFEFHNVNVQNAPASKTIKAIGKLLETPVLIDDNALAHHEIDLDKVLVTHPRSRTVYGIALRKLLFQAKLKYKVRLDDADKPFLWITTIRPMK